MYCTGILRHIDRSNILTRTSWRYIEPQYALLWTYSTIHIARFCLKNIHLAVCITPSRPRVLKFPNCCSTLQYIERNISYCPRCAKVVRTSSGGKSMAVICTAKKRSYGTFVDDSGDFLKSEQIYEQNNRQIIY